MHTTALKQTSMHMYFLCTAKVNKLGCLSANVCASLRPHTHESALMQNTYMQASVPLRG